MRHAFFLSASEVFLPATLLSSPSMSSLKWETVSMRHAFFLSASEVFLPKHLRHSPHVRGPLYRMTDICASTADEGPLKACTNFVASLISASQPACVMLVLPSRRRTTSMGLFRQARVV